MILERLDSLGTGPDIQVQGHLDAEFLVARIPEGNQTSWGNGDQMTSILGPIISGP